MNWLSNIGGLRGWLQLAGTFLCSSFASFNLSGLLANRIYKWQAPASFEKAVHALTSPKEKPSNQIKSEAPPKSLLGKLSSKLKKKTDDKSWFMREVAMHVPAHLDFTALYFSWLACWCKPKWYRDYRASIGKVNSDVSR